MEEIITNCILTTEKNIDETVANMSARKICKYDDIMNEFLQWTKTHSYDFVHPISSGGYTAKKISEMAPFLSGVGVYNFMASLRDDPELAKNCITNGFIIK